MHGYRLERGEWHDEVALEECGEAAKGRMVSLEHGGLQQGTRGRRRSDHQETCSSPRVEPRPRTHTAHLQHRDDSVAELPLSIVDGTRTGLGSWQTGEHGRRAAHGTHELGEPPNVAAVECGIGLAREPLPSRGRLEHVADAVQSLLHAIEYFEVRNVVETAARRLRSSRWGNGRRRLYDGS